MANFNGLAELIGLTRGVGFLMLLLEIVGQQRKYTDKKRQICHVSAKLCEDFTQFCANITGPKCHTS